MRLSSLLCWSIILIIALGMPVLGAYAQYHAKQRTAAGQPAHPNATVEPGMQTAIMGKYLVGTGSLFGKEAVKPNLYTLNAPAHTPADRIAVAIIYGEYDTPEAAIQRLDAIDSPDARAFANLYAAHDPLTEDLRNRYGFFARLAEVHGRPDTDPARAALLASATHLTAFVLIGGLAVLLLFILGLGLLITAIVLLCLGKIRFPNLAPDTSPDGPTGLTSPAPGSGPAPGPIYLQSFTLYLSLLIGVIVTFSLISWRPPMWSELLFLSAAVIAAILYAISRGIPTPQLRRDWGLHSGKGIFLEMGAGIVGYLTGLPLLAIGALTASLLAKWSHTEITHPITAEFKDHMLLMTFLAVVFAPITEELLFRGVFLSYLRSILPKPPSPNPTTPSTPYPTSSPSPTGTPYPTVTPYPTSTQFPTSTQHPTSTQPAPAYPAPTYPTPATPTRVSPTPPPVPPAPAPLFPNAPVPAYPSYPYDPTPPAHPPAPIAAPLISPLLAGLISSFIFASIHPQGWAGIPMIGAIGFTLASIRQWRGTLISSITAHALNNGFVTLLLYFTLT
jgi:membrane protease YdiL (CAAX protease family)